MPARDVEKILLLRFSSMGDIVMTTAMIRCVRKRFPNARIDMVVREDLLDLIAHNPHLTNAIGLPRKQGLAGLRKLMRQIDAVGYDLVYDAHRSLRTRLMMPKLKADQKAYHRKHYIRRNWALTFKYPRMNDHSRMLERFIRPLEPFGVQYDGGGPEVFLDSAWEASWRLKVNPVNESTGLTVGIVPSAQWEGKRWPLKSFRALLETLVTHTAHQIVLFGGPGDSFVSKLIANLPTNRILNTQGKLTLGESMAALNIVDVVIANDTGLMHVADALNIPSVLIMGPTSAELGCLPFHPQSQILEHALWCRPCSKNGQAPCIRGNRLCLTQTTVGDVFEATLKVIRENTGPDKGHQA